MDGVLVVDKSAGPTSHDVVDEARRVLGERRVGHTGTLDPFATGVLPLCVGKATRLARFLSGGDKVYRASVRLGFATTTDDLTGAALSEPRDGRVARGELERALAGLVGSFDQVPPVYSARHVAGRRLYELARRGQTPERAATPVTVHALALLRQDGDRLEVEVRCSPGTYVRAIARDLGERLSVGGHLTALRRTRSGAFDLGRAVRLEAGPVTVRDVIPLSELLPDFPAVRVGAAGLRLVRSGRDLDAQSVEHGFPQQALERVRVVDDQGRLLALAVPRGLADTSSKLPCFPVLHPDVVLVD